MSLLTAQRRHSYRGTRVLLMTNGHPVTVELVADPTVARGTIDVVENYNRISGSKFTGRVVGTTLVLEGESVTRKITAKNTGDATVHGGGVANTGVIIGDQRRHNPDEVAYNRFDGDGGPLTVQHASGNAALIITVGTAGCEYALA